MRSDVAPGPVIRGTIVAAAIATAVVVVSAVMQSGRGHWAAALVALPLLVGAVVIARFAYPRLLWATATALGLMIVAVATGGLVALAEDAAWSIGIHVAAAGGSLAASLVALVVSFRGEPVAMGPWRDYITLTKPRIMSLLLVTGACGMIGGAHGIPSAASFAAAMVGLALACGGASALNHLLDADIDRLMGKRTETRPVASGRVPPARALEFGLALSAFSFVLLAAAVNLLAAVLALAGNLFYVLVYTRWLKRSTPENIVLGGAAGAMPPLVGWAAGSGHLAWPALALFAIVFLWTPPHFWALALLLREQYAAANVPMLPVVRGEQETVRRIVAYTAVLLVCSVVPFVFGMFGIVYLGGAVMLGGMFLLFAARLARRPSRRHAAFVFHYSLLYLALLFVAAAVDLSL
jgi:heme o synthase